MAKWQSPNAHGFALSVVIAVVLATIWLQLFGRWGSFQTEVVAVHDAVGCLLGYWGARALHLGERGARTVAIEAGLQKGGMATGLAMDVLKSAQAGLAPAIFGPWMNPSGSVLASSWRRRPPAPVNAGGS